MSKWAKEAENEKSGFLEPEKLRSGFIKEPNESRIAPMNLVIHVYTR